MTTVTNDPMRVTSATQNPSQPESDDAAQLTPMEARRQKRAQTTPLYRALAAAVKAYGKALGKPGPLPSGVYIAYSHAARRYVVSFSGWALSDDVGALAGFPVYVHNSHPDAATQQTMVGWERIGIPQNGRTYKLIAPDAAVVVGKDAGEVSGPDLAAMWERVEAAPNFPMLMTSELIDVATTYADGIGDLRRVGKLRPQTPPAGSGAVVHEVWERAYYIPRKQADLLAPSADGLNRQYRWAGVTLADAGLPDWQGERVCVVTARRADCSLLAGLFISVVYNG